MKYIFTFGIALLVGINTVSGQCNLAAEVDYIFCDDNGTICDPSDNVFYVWLNITGSQSGWATNDPGWPEEGGLDGLHEFGPYPVSEGAISIVITDPNEADCEVQIDGITPNPVCDPAISFELQATINAIFIDDNGTPGVCSDDTYMASVTVSALGFGYSSGWRFIFGNGNFVPGALYGEELILGPYPLYEATGQLNNQHFNINDNTVLGCGAEIIINPEAPINCECEVDFSYSLSSYVQDNGTPEDCSDNFSRLTFSDNSLWVDGGYEMLLDDEQVFVGVFGSGGIIQIPADSVAHSLTMRSLEENDCFATYDLPIVYTNCPLDPVTFFFNDTNACGTENVCVAVQAINFDNILGFNTSVNYDPEFLTFTGSINFNPVMVGFNSPSIGTPSPGNLTMNWNDPFAVGVSIPEEEALLELCFTPVVSTSYLTSLSYGNTPVPTEIVGGEIPEDVPFILNAGSLSCQCELTLAEVALPFDDNGTPGQCSDDEFSLLFTVNNNQDPTGIWLAEDENGILLFTGTYGVATEIGPFPVFSNILEQTPIALNIYDANDNNCFFAYTYEPSIPPGCNCEAALDFSPGLVNDNGTPLDCTDDFYVIAFTANFINPIGGTYKVFVDGSLAYQWVIGDEVGYVDVPADGGEHVIMVRDLSVSCSESYPLPAVDSACEGEPCELSIDWTTAVFDNGTPSTCADDFFTIPVIVTGTNEGTEGWSLHDNLGSTYSGNYGSITELGPYPGAAPVQINLTFSDNENIVCQSTISVDNPLADCDEYNILQGTAYRSEDCLTNGTALTGWLVEVSGDDYLQYRLTDDAGNYQMAVPQGTFQLRLLPLSPAWGVCEENGQTVVFSGYGETLSQVLLAQPLDNCPLLEVSMEVGILRPCFVNRTLSLAYENVGTDTLFDGLLAVILPAELTYSGTTGTYQGSAGDTLFFAPELPLAPGASRQFTVYVDVACNNALIGSSLCVTALGLPYGPCPQASAAWGGGSLQVSGECNTEEVVFTLRNVGDATLSPGGSYIVIQDGVMLWEVPEDIPPLDPDEATTVSFPANGNTFLLEAEQEPFHPGFSNPSVVLEGCGTNEEGVFSVGYVTQFPNDEEDIFVDEDCRVVTASYDPNDKQAEPLGYATEHYVLPERSLEYTIRFQNTGTDTAFTVVIRDTLSQWLDMRTLQPGVGSHPYELQLDTARAMSFVFNDILLPDSTTNIEASQGFVTFKVKPLLTAPLGTRIENTAAIYFDFNDPIITNTVYHTLGRDFIDLVNWVANPTNGVTWRIFPNPNEGQLNVEWSPATERAILMVTDAWGRQQARFVLAGGKMELDVRFLPPGWYGLQLIGARGHLLGAGKLIRK